MNRQPDRTEDAYRAALGVMVEDTPPAPEWEDLLLPTEPIRSRLATTPRRGWAVALVAAGVIFVLVGGIAISVIAFGSNEEVIEPPPTTMPTSIPEVFLDGRITAPAYADVPFFTGTVQYYEHDPVSGLEKPCDPH